MRGAETKILASGSDHHQAGGEREPLKEGLGPQEVVSGRDGGRVMASSTHRDIIGGGTGLPAKVRCYVRVLTSEETQSSPGNPELWAKPAEQAGQTGTSSRDSPMRLSGNLSTDGCQNSVLGRESPAA